MKNYFIHCFKVFIFKNEIDHTKLLFEQAVRNFNSYPSYTFTIKTIKKIRKNISKKITKFLFLLKNLKLLFALKMVLLDRKRKEHSKNFYKIKCKKRTVS